MGLLTDSFFIRAIKSMPTYWRCCLRVTSTTMWPISMIWKTRKCPHISVNNDGGSGRATPPKTAWSEFEDKVNISILMVCRSRQELADMTLAVRKTISDFMKATWQRISEGTSRGRRRDRTDWRITSLSATSPYIHRKASAPSDVLLRLHDSKRNLY